MSRITINRESLRWLLLEGTVVVFSILIAFWIDAWWEDRSERRDEQLILAALLDEFEEKKVIVEAQRIYMGAILDATRTLLYASTQTPIPLEAGRVDELLADIWWNNGASLWTVPTLDSLISSGDIAYVSDVDLRNDLIAWSIRFRSLQEVVRREVDFYDDRLMTHMEQHASMPQIMNTVDHVPGYPEISYDFGATFQLDTTVDHRELLGDRKFQGLLMRRSILLNDILSQSFNNLEDDLATTIASVRSHVDN